MKATDIKNVKYVNHKYFVLSKKSLVTQFISVEFYNTMYIEQNQSHLL